MNINANQAASFARRNARTALHAQRGAALATAMLFLVILTLLGLAAMRSGNVDLRLSQNEGSRLDAQQNAESAVNTVLSSAASIAVMPGSGYLQSCSLGTNLVASQISSLQNFTCPTGTAAAPLPATDYAPYLYVSVRREQINGNDFAPPSAVGAGDSGDRYQYASFTITGGYDRISTTDSTTYSAMGGAEVSEGLYVKVAQVRGLTQQ